MLLCFCLVASLFFLVRIKSFHKKKNKEFKTVLITSFTLLLNSYYYKNEFFLSHSLSIIQSFSMITIFFSYQNLFQLLQLFKIITVFFNYHSSFNYHNLFESLYNLWHYLYENKPAYEFYHLTHIFNRQNMAKIFC